MVFGFVEGFVSWTVLAIVFCFIMVIGLGCICIGIWESLVVFRVGRMDEIGVDEISPGSLVKLSGVVEKNRDGDSVDLLFSDSDDVVLCEWLLDEKKEFRTKSSRWQCIDDDGFDAVTANLHVDYKNVGVELEDVDEMFLEMFDDHMLHFDLDEAPCRFNEYLENHSKKINSDSFRCDYNCIEVGDEITVVGYVRESDGDTRYSIGSTPDSMRMPFFVTDYSSAKMKSVYVSSLLLVLYGLTVVFSLSHVGLSLFVDLSGDVVSMGVLMLSLIVGFGYVVLVDSLKRLQSLMKRYIS